MTYTVLNYSAITNLDCIDFNKDVRVINKKRSVTLSCMGFDIETTNLIDRYDNGMIKNAKSIMYHWQFGIDKWVILGRTWEQLKQFFTWLDSKLTTTCIIWVANLGFEFSFLMGHYEIQNCFAREPYHPLKFRILNHIEFRDCLQITGGNLEYLAKNYCSPDNQKKVGDVDFNKIRHTKTPVTEKETGYYINDVTILIEFAGYMFEHYFDIPLTKTGILRSECKTEFDKLRPETKKFIQSLLPTENEYNLVMQYLFSGGYTHGNIFLINQVQKNVAGLDIVSSYPAVMLQEYFPMSKFYKHVFTVTDGKITDSALDDYCCYFTAVFTRVRIKHSHSILSEHKLIYAQNAKYDNGKLISADAIKVMMTELDYQNFSMFYTWHDCKVRGGKIAKRGKLPCYLTDLIKKYYQLKTDLSNQGKKNTMDYMLAKQKLNSFYGMTVTKIVRVEQQFDNVTLMFRPVQSKKTWAKVRHSTFLSPYWGIWVTAHARNRLLTMIHAITKNSETVSDVIYSDTDSIYVRNYERHKDIIDNFNNRIAALNKTLPDDFKTLGTFGLDGIHDTFKCLGAKRYMYHDGCIYHATIAGVNGDVFLDQMPKCTDPYKNFDLYNTAILDMDVSQKHAHAYFPRKNEYLENNYVIVDDGETKNFEPCFSGCAIFDVPFKLTFSDKWVHMLQRCSEFIYFEAEETEP